MVFFDKYIPVDKLNIEMLENLFSYSDFRSLNENTANDLLNALSWALI